MSEERPISVELEIDEARPLSGRLRERGAPWCGFAGWIGLAGAIDGVLARNPGDGTPDPAAAAPPGTMPAGGGADGSPAPGPASG